jgi:hypothetical protein
MHVLTMGRFRSSRFDCPLSSISNWGLVVVFVLFELFLCWYWVQVRIFDSLLSVTST